MHNFAINNRYLYMIECHLLKKNTVINKIVLDFMDTLYNRIEERIKPLILFLFDTHLISIFESN